MISNSDLNKNLNTDIKDEGKLIVLSGPSGVGKGTIVRRLLEEDDCFKLSVSATTRAPREEDAEGVTYFFKTVDCFKDMIDNGEFLEWAVYNGNYYGTPLNAVRQSLKKGYNVILEIEVQGAVKVKEKCPEGLFIFIAPPDTETLRKRLCGRGSESQDEIEKRVAAAESELKLKDEYDYIVTNNIVDEAVSEIKRIIEKA